MNDGCVHRVIVPLHELEQLVIDRPLHQQIGGDRLRVEHLAGGFDARDRQSGRVDESKANKGIESVRTFSLIVLGPAAKFD